MAYKKLTMLALTCFTLVGCVSTSKGPSMHPELGEIIQLDSTSTFQADNLENDRKKIVIIGSSKGGNENNNLALADALFTRLSSRGLNPVDRELSKRLRSEILLAVNDGKQVVKSPESIDYVVLATVTTAESSSKFEERHTYEKKDGKIVEVPDICRYKYSVSGKVEIRDLAKRSLLTQFEFSDRDSESVRNPADKSCSINNKSESNAFKKLYNDIWQSGEASRNLMNFLSPKYYVVGAFQLDNKIYYKITAGIGKGAKDGRKVNLFVETASGSLLFFGTGKFINEKFADSQYSYITIDKKVQQRIKKGTVVKIGSESCSALDLKCHLQDTFIYK